MPERKGEGNRQGGSFTFSSAQREKPTSDGGNQRKKEREKQSSRSGSIDARQIHERGQGSRPVPPVSITIENSTEKNDSLSALIMRIEATTTRLKSFIREHRLDPRMEGKSLGEVIDTDLNRAQELVKLFEAKKLTPQGLEDAKEEMEIILENLESYHEQLNGNEGTVLIQDEKKDDEREGATSLHGKNEKTRKEKGTTILKELLEKDLPEAKVVFLNAIKNWGSGIGKDRDIEKQIHRSRFNGLRKLSSQEQKQFMQELQRVNTELAAAFDARKVALQEERKSRRRMEAAESADSPEASLQSSGVNVINLAEQRKLRTAPTAWEKLGALEQQQLRRTLFRMKDDFIKKVKQSLTAQNIRAERPLQILAEEACAETFPVFIERVIPVALSPEEKADIIQELRREIIVGE